MNRYLQILLLFTSLFMLNACTLDEDLDPFGTGDDRDRYKGTWLFSESEARSISYSVTISKDTSNSSQVIMENIGNFGSSYSAYGIATSSKIVLPAQEISPGMTIEGAGSLSTSTLMEWDYTITGGGESTSYHATATK